MADSNETRCLSCDTVSTRDWYAWLNRMPPPPDDFHVSGEVLVPNPGVDVLLVPKQPQGINPAYLLMDLYLVQRSGIWPQVQVWKAARYDKTPAGTRYERVQVFCGAKEIADVPVEVMH